MKNKQEWGLLILRIVLGLSFSIHGFDKLNGGIESIATWFSSLGLPGIFAYGVALLEVMGGIALIFGFATRLLSSLFTIVMIVAILKVKLAAGFQGSPKAVGFELELSYLTISIVLLLNGSRLFSVDESLFPTK